MEWLPLLSVEIKAEGEESLVYLFARVGWLWIGLTPIYPLLVNIMSDISYTY